MVDYGGSVGTTGCYVGKCFYRVLLTNNGTMEEKHVSRCSSGTWGGMGKILYTFKFKIKCTINISLIY